MIWVVVAAIDAVAVAAAAAAAAVAAFGLLLVKGVHGVDISMQTTATRKSSPSTK